MRVISGKFGGLRLESVKSDKTRPTTDKVKESLFSMLGQYFDGGNFLDLFAGSGAVGIEAVSRGFDAATLVDRQFQAIKTIKDNVAKVNAANQFTVIKGSAEKVLLKLAADQAKFDMVFLDPPYKQQKMMETMAQLLELNLLNDDAIVVCETDNTVSLPAELNSYQQLKHKEYGLTVVWVYRLEGGNGK
ncbi:16S rRNA (guanine(966)-N(2))-methyltransferase RsmD [Lentilactobacillus kribbianus]|uniref:16S rRNA (guanine(966)-N(2))-methyltransferase RsmD n=1 Tax=Lentilactobacillus kribbianus TaxID=2729622 RepID=UPI0015555E2D|nr:16S rRNA (guanine(966)-N(2))-methyltransferase RsmD [Lentilactobacillus kribbianus]